ncbi:MAG: DNA polymerase III, subunit gamma and tau [Candidatus Accumulibacter sp. 66-26]|mgnify:CR=1 FL=1|nr:DNA polymerase III subunit gamma/tau [Accumulibacter sp.]OJW46715.1 MAG: DNA polymerase III, subunit gamma and tau [Candidatus Accumulibacter sp. 66-26]
MSYQVLARKWRPKSFASLVGQEHVVRALNHALTEQRLHHAYLFTGTRGVGKTTLARILAKALNCETGITATPCGTCSACAEIDSGRFVDLLEVDAATNTRVDEMRQLLENAVYAPTRGRFKVYVIDEVHMLSNSAFNAMLKTLEEPPEHVKFILATTDPQKIPVTVLSRCLQFNLKQMTPPSIAGHLTHILDAEAISAEPGALNLIARSAAGSMRDALSLLDQAIAHGSGKVEEAQVRDMLGTVDLDYLFLILDALLGGDAAAMLAVADDMATRSLSFDAALQELASLLTRIQIAQLAPQAVADDLPERARLLELAGRFDPEFVQLAYQIAVHGRKELPLAPDEQAGFTMALLRLHAFRPQAATDVSPRRSESPASELRGTPQVRTAPAVQRQSAPLAAAPSPSQRIVPASPSVAEAVPAQPAVSRGERPIGGDWHTILGALKLGGMARELGQHCELRAVEGELIILRLSPTHRHLQMKPAQDKLHQTLSEYFGRAVQLRIELAEVESATPAVVAQRDRQERQDRAVAAIEQDGFVREVIETFDATLIESSIKPI